MLPEEVQLLFCLFDILHLDGEPLAKLPLRIRHEKLAAAIKAAPTAVWRGLTVEITQRPRDLLVPWVDRGERPERPDSVVKALK